MGGKATIRGLRVTVGAILGLLAAGHSPEEVRAAYPYLEREDIREAIAYGASCADEEASPRATESIASSKEERP